MAAPPISVLFASLIVLTPLSAGSLYKTLAGDTSQAWATDQGTVIYQEVDPSTQQPINATTNETLSQVFHSIWFTTNDPLVPYTSPPVIAVPSSSPTVQPTSLPTSLPTGL